MLSSIKRSPIPSSSRYEFQTPIGTGGMGTVYRAFDKSTKQLVAIKVLSVKLSVNPTLHFRLAREFRAASELEHPNIVRALAIENDGELSYLVYELVEGGSLGERVEKQGRLPVEMAIRVITQIAQALQYAHERQVVHRDVKPDNILMTSDGKVKLTDFGLAKDFSVEDEALTRAASALGTPHFMAPEQFADAKSVDSRSDVYSLAATLYNLLTGKLPFDASMALAILTKKEKLDLPPASSFVYGISSQVDQAILAALQPEPDMRPATCLDFFKLLTGTGRALLQEDVLTTPAPIRTTRTASANNRIAARFPLGMGSCGVIDSDIHNSGNNLEMWPLVVNDVSTGGIGVLLARRFEPGTELAIDLAIERGAEPERLAVRVVRVQSEKAGHWIHGCAFVNPLTNDQLKSLIKFA